jgi:hypothetical protein
VAFVTAQYGDRCSGARAGACNLRAHPGATASYHHHPTGERMRSKDSKRIGGESGRTRHRHIVTAPSLIVNHWFDFVWLCTKTDVPE